VPVTNFKYLKKCFWRSPSKTVQVNGKIQILLKKISSEINSKIVLFPNYRKAKSIFSNCGLSGLQNSATGPWQNLNFFYKYPENLFEKIVGKPVVFYGNQIKHKKSDELY
jgi:hypothetical protein